MWEGGGVGVVWGGGQKDDLQGIALYEICNNSLILVR